MIIIKCPYCMLKGENKNIAEILPDGVKVIRSSNGTVDFTIIKTNSFSLICGKCGNTVVYKSESVSLPKVSVSINLGSIYSYYGTN